MNIFSYKQTLRWYLPAWVLITVFILPFAVCAADGPAAEKTPEKSKIHISADTLSTDSQSKVAEFKGNVRATQEKTVIIADSLKIYYTQGQGSTPGASAITKIIAAGNVKITFDEKVAVAEKAVYTAKTRVMVLSGPNCKISSGKDSLSGEKITYYRDDERVQVESGKKQRVEAVFFSGGKGIN